MKIIRELTLRKNQENKNDETYNEICFRNEQKRRKINIR